MSFDFKFFLGKFFIKSIHKVFGNHKRSCPEEPVYTNPTQAKSRAKQIKLFKSLNFFFHCSKSSINWVCQSKQNLSKLRVF